MISASALRVWVASFLAACVLLVAPAARADMKVAVVDVQRAVMQTEDGLRAQATLKKLFDSRQQELNKKQQELGKQKEELDKQQRTLSAEAFQKRAEAWQRQAVDLQTVFVEYNKELEKKQKELTDPIVEKLMSIVKRIATTENYDLVVERQFAHFYKSELDLTDRCIQMYNAGGAAPVAGGAPKK